MVDFTSTRELRAEANAYEAVLNGIAPDGGLYVPTNVPKIDVSEILNLSYTDLARRIIGAMLPSFTAEEIAESASEAYKHHFETPDVCPLKKVGDDFVLELFHGETAAFKDVALSILPRLMTRARKALGKTEKILILTATSGDTGSAAMNGFRDVDGTGIIVFYPFGGVSEIQKRQMVAMPGGNLTACALRGNFDDCQSAVKRAFANLPAPNGIRFSSANSINIARLVPQIAYYYASYASLVRDYGMKIGESVDFVVPTGNFGDILAGWYAKRMGLPIGTLVCASNANRVLTDFIETGVYDRRREFVKTSSPSMDILISSNLERLLYHAEGEDGRKVARLMKELSENGFYRASDEAMKKIRSDFAAYSFDDDMTVSEMKTVFDETGYFPDPHTAVGMACLKAYKNENPGRRCVVLATASPFKFPQSAMRALGMKSDGTDAFEMLKKISDVIGVPVPPCIAPLENAQPIHNDVTDKEHIFEYILGKAVSL